MLSKLSPSIYNLYILAENYFVQFKLLPFSLIPTSLVYWVAGKTEDKRKCLH